MKYDKNCLACRQMIHHERHDVVIRKRNKDLRAWFR